MDTSLNAILGIRTPEGVIFSLTLAGPVTRFLALGTDAAVILALNVLISTALSPFSSALPGVGGALNLVIYFALSIGYAITLEWYWRGQTLGKRLLRLRVMDVQGLRLQFSQIAVRNLLRFVDMIPLFYCVGGTAMLCNRRNQRLGDLVANTIVVHIPRIESPDFESVQPCKYNSFHDYPHIEVRLRDLITPAEAGLVVQALLRRAKLDPDARVVLYAEIVAHLKELCGTTQFPEEMLTGLTDEQYLRNVVDSVFRYGTKSGVRPKEEASVPHGASR